VGKMSVTREIGETRIHKDRQIDSRRRAKRTRGDGTKIVCRKTKMLTGTSSPLELFMS
jgi:hypothetical protein